MLILFEVGNLKRFTRIAVFVYLTPAAKLVNYIILEISNWFTHKVSLLKIQMQHLQIEDAHFMEYDAALLCNRFQTF